MSDEMSGVEGERSDSIPLQFVNETLEQDGLNKKPRLMEYVRSGAKKHWRNWTAAICLWFAYLVCGIAYSIMAPFFPDEAEKKGFGPIITGVIVSSAPLLVVILSPVFGYLLPYTGFRFMISAGLALIGSSFVLLGIADLLPSNWIFAVYCIVLKIAEGVGSAMFITATFAVLPILFPKSIATVVGLMEVGGGLGFAMGPPVGGLLYQYGGFKLPFFFVGGLVLVFFIPCTILVKEKSATKKSSTPFKLVLKIFADPAIILLVVGLILGLAAFAFFTPTVQPFLNDQFHLNPLKVGLVFFIAPATYLLSALFIGPVSDSLGHRIFIVPGFLVYGLGFCFIGPAEFIAQPRLWLTCLAFAVLGISAGAAVVPIYADMLNKAKTYLEEDDKEGVESLTSLVSGVVTASMSFGEFIGPLIGGGLTEVLSFQTSSFLFGEILIAKALALAGVTLIAKYTRHRL